MFNKLIFVSFSTLVLCNNVLCQENPIVETQHGQISGKVWKTLFKNINYFGFLGIPFAEPPLGELKFMDPKPVEPWQGVLSATKLKPACIQFNHNIKKGQPYGLYGSEDCLYLDIFTPGVDKEKRAVVVFTYNHYFYNSYNKTKDYAPDFFIEEDIVVVTISHRLSAFGFLSLESETLPGNAGLKDIVLSLEWIRDNIENFGGDPNRITMMGAESGAAAIDLLIHSKAKSLFSAAILQSGTSWTPAQLQKDVRERAFKLGKMMNITTSSEIILLKELRNVDNLQIASRDVHACPDDYFKETQNSVIAFGPIVEKQPRGLITEYPESSDSEINIPILMGYNSREGLEPSLEYLKEPRFLPFVNKDFPLLFPIRVNFAFDPRKQVFSDARVEIKNFYFPKGKINVKNVPEIVTLTGDTIVNYALDYTARLYSKRSSKPVFYYHFDYYSELNENKNAVMNLSVVEDGTWGTATGDEMCYLFKCPNLKNVYLKLKQQDSEELIVQKKMLRLWANFIKYGNPTPDNDEILEGLKWPTYTIENKEYLDIGKELKIKTDLNKERYEFWDNFIEKWGQRAVNGIISESIKDEL
ncbi:unnamed protein product [Arctia plantaginis]|uniref:Carboxylesterase type B domain-containing protein n=1 Tax=Arctia plantaginis TaxID=874455 RepID=A0A8S0ZB46_ARCPL|nr:unnamed protein product [Arctia plantaginis]CAB3257147.1 unnamed protein product [Arctia plantaginis]